MKKFALASLSTLVAASACHAQCDVWDSLMALAGQSGSGPVLSTTLDNNEEFVVWVDSSTGVVGVFLGEAGTGWLYSLTTNQACTAVTVDNAGNTCKFVAASDGSLTITVEAANPGIDFTTTRFVIDDTGAMGPTDKCKCKGTGGTVTRTCTEVGCDSGWTCRTFPTGDSESCGWVRVIED